jgi:probable F420-dependent oxidoreductase
MNLQKAANGATAGALPAQRIGRIGIWAMELRYGEVSQIIDAAAELEALGFRALWIPGVSGGEILKDVSRLLSATKNCVVATGILNIWMHSAHEVGSWWHELPESQTSRFLLGLGVSHSVTVGEAYAKPLTVMKDYLVELFGEGLPTSSLCLAALGPKMLELARDKTAGAHPYLVTPEHTATARESLGSGALLAPEQGVVLEADPARAREIARPYVKGYGQLANYANSWRRLGFSDEDIATTSDTLVDALFAWGPPEKIAERVNAHFEAGADHVCLQVVGSAPPRDVEAIRPAWRELAAMFLERRKLKT